MNHLFVTYEIALKLKYLGFNEKCLAKINHRNELTLVFNLDEPITNQFLTISASAPTWDQVIEWLRTKQSISIAEDLERPNAHCFRMSINGQLSSGLISHNSHNDSKRVAIELALKIIEEKGNLK